MAVVGILRWQMKGWRGANGVVELGLVCCSQGAGRV